MKLIGKKNFKFKQIDFLNAIICIILIALSGTIQFSYIWYSESIIAVTVFSIGLFIFHTKKIKVSTSFILILLVIIVMTNILVYPINIGGHISLLMKLFSCYVLVNYIKPDIFSRYYINIICFLAIVSLFCFILLIINPQFIFNNVPAIEYWDHTTRYAFLYNFPLNEFTIRNFGPFHEGGMWAVFLNIALILHLENNQVKSKYFNLKTIVLIVTIITTISTTGFIICSIIIIYKLINKKNIKSIVLFSFLLVILIIVEQNIGIISNKFDSSNSSFVDRTSEFEIFLQNIKNSPIYGVGYQNNSHIDGTGLKNFTNGLLSLILQFGFLPSMIIICIYIKGVKNISNNLIDFFIKFVMLLVFIMSEPVIFHPLFICILFYKNGILNFNDSSIYISERNTIISKRYQSMSKI